MARFAFDFGSLLSAPLRLALAGPLTPSVRVEQGVLDIRFGLLRLRTPVSNVEEVTVTGPYHPLKALGVHVSLSDLGLTFGSSYRQGVCIRFRRPVSGVLPVPLLAHPAVTVTVAEPWRLKDALLDARDAALDEEHRLADAAHAVTAKAPTVRSLVPVDDPDVTPLTARAASRLAARPSGTPRPAVVRRPSATSRSDGRAATPGSALAEPGSADEGKVAPPSAEQAPVEEAPVEEAPVDEAPVAVEEVAVEEAPAEQPSPRETAAKRTAAERAAATKRAPVKRVPTKRAPVKGVVAKKATPVKGVAAKKATPVKGVAAKKATSVRRVEGEVDARRLAGNLPDVPPPAAGDQPPTDS